MAVPTDATGIDAESSTSFFSSGRRGNSTADRPLPVATLSLAVSLSPFPPVQLPSSLSALSFPLPSSSPHRSRRAFSVGSSAVLAPCPSRSPSIAPSNPSGGAFLPRRRSVLWFRADLRLHDNEALVSAVAESSSILPLFVFDPRDYGRSKAGFDRTGPYRAKFLLDSVADLRNSLHGCGAELFVRVGRPESVLAEMARAAGADVVYAHREVSRDECRVEREVEKALEKVGVETKFFWGSTLYHVEDLPFGLEDMPSNYGGFREQVNGVAVRKAMAAPEEVKVVKCGVEPGEIPTLSELGLSQPTTVAQDGKLPVGSGLVGGETEALDRLKKFAAECRAQPNKVGKDGKRENIYGANFSCKISPWLATGCLSPRFMYEEIKKYTMSFASSLPTAKNNGDAKNSSGASDSGMNWLMFELLWRDFFRFITKKYSSPKKNLEALPAIGCAAALA